MVRFPLLGKIIVQGSIKAVTGLHIGTVDPGLQIGGLDLAVVRNPLTKHPYIPGSSLRGKMRSLLEKHIDKEFNHVIQQAPKPVRIHMCKEKGKGQCELCRVFGVSADVEYEENEPARLIIRDVPLSGETAEKLEKQKTDLPYTEVKMEVTIDRITSQAVPRQVERVPAGSIFKPFVMVFNIYKENDCQLFSILQKGMELLEDDYLGGHGVRGSGKVSFKNITVELKPKAYYDKKSEVIPLKKDLDMKGFREVDFVSLIQENLIRTMGL